LGTAPPACRRPLPYTTLFRSRLLAAGVDVCFPRLTRKRRGEMEAAHVRRLEELEPGPFFGIPQPPEAAPAVEPERLAMVIVPGLDRKSTRLNSSHVKSSYAVF